MIHRSFLNIKTDQTSNMKKFFLILFSIAFTIGAIGQKQVNDPNAVVRDVKGYNAIKVSNAFDVYISQGSEEVVAVSAVEEKYRDKIRTVVENGVLKISFDNDKKFWKGFDGDKMKLKAYVSVKDIKSIDVSGACNVHVVGPLKADNLEIELSGASDLDADITVNKLSVKLSGASDVNLKGKTGEITVDVSGASDFKGYDLVADYCKAEASGASGIRLTVNKEISAKASGASDVNYKGEASVQQAKTSGASNVKKS